MRISGPFPLLVFALCGILEVPATAQPILRDRRLTEFDRVSASFVARRRAWLLGTKGARDPRSDVIRSMARLFEEGDDTERHAAARWLVAHDVSVPSLYGERALRWMIRNTPTTVDWPLVSRRARFLGRRSLYRLVHDYIESNADSSFVEYAKITRSRLAFDLFDVDDARCADARTHCAKLHRAWLVSKPAKIVDVGERRLRVEMHTLRWTFEASLAQRLRRIDFEDIPCRPMKPTSFADDRYVRSHGIVIQGQKGQFVGMSFGFPDDYRPKSGTNMFAPGPVARRKDKIGSGGNRSTLTFRVGAKPAAVAGFGCNYLDCDHPHVARSRLRAWAGDTLLLDATHMLSPHGLSVFVGLVVRDSNGQLVDAVTKVELVNGSHWPAVENGDGVTLDDFTFSPPRVPR